MGKAKTPPIDWLKALVLERIPACHLDLKGLSTLTGYSYSHTRKMISSPSADWNGEYRRKVCAALGIEIAELPTEIQLAIARY